MKKTIILLVIALVFNACAPPPEPMQLSAETSSPVAAESTTKPGAAATVTVAAAQETSTPEVTQTPGTVLYLMIDVKGEVEMVRTAGLDENYPMRRIKDEFALMVVSAQGNAISAHQTKDIEGNSVNVVHLPYVEKMLGPDGQELSFSHVSEDGQFAFFADGSGTSVLKQLIRMSAQNGAVDANGVRYDDGSINMLRFVDGEVKTLPTVFNWYDEVSVNGSTVKVNGEELAWKKLEDGEWKEVIQEQEYIYLAGSPEEKQILEDFVEDFQRRYKEQHGKEWTFDDVPDEYRLHWKDQEGNDLGMVEYGVLNSVWENVEDDSYPDFNKNKGFVSGVIAGVVLVNDNGGMDKLVMFSETQDGKITVNLIDTVYNNASTQTYVYGEGVVSKDQMPLFYSGKRIGGVEDVTYVQMVKAYFEKGEDPFQVLVDHSLGQRDYKEFLFSMWEDVVSIFEGGINEYKNDERIPTMVDFNPTSIYIPREVVEKLGLGF